MQRSSTEPGRFRFPQATRLLDAKAYGRVFDNAQRSRDRMFTILYRDKQAGGARLGLAISKKNCRLAVGRNRIKRIVRESFRQHRQALGKLDIVVLNKPGTHQASKEALMASLEQHWLRCQADLQDQAGKTSDG